MASAQPLVSVIIPVKNSQATIRRTVESLLRQDYGGPIEIILIGDHDDPTWTPLHDHIANGAVRIVEVALVTGGRDANAKRNIGLRRACGDVLALTDSDMVLPAHWISTGVALLGEGWACVTGPMASVDGGFWGTYADKVLLGAKTPRMAGAYILDAANFGSRGYKPPVTANVLLTRAAYEATGGLDAAFRHSYEDYEWFWRLAAGGRRILCSPALVAEHYHRQGWRSVLREYRRSGRGCADFVRKHPQAPFARRRLMHLAIVLAAPLVALCALALLGAGAAVCMGGLLAAGLVLLGAASVRATRRLHAAVYPLVTLALGLTFSYGLARGLAGHMPRRAGTSPALAPDVVAHEYRQGARTAVAVSRTAILGARAA